MRVSQLRKLRECEQVAAVCYRRRGEEIEFLLVQTRGSGRWTFPKGNTEPGLTHAQAAALEAFEEAGVHGRIEEESFTRYVRRERGDARKSATGSTATETAVNVHLCEVSRLSPPQEAKRNPTWFSLVAAKRRLREGREDEDGTALARVVDTAAARIQRMHSGARLNPDLARGAGNQRDALQRVSFEIGESAYRRIEMASLAAYLRGGLRRRSAEIGEVNPRQVLQAEVLPFGLLKKKKVNALGSGTRGTGKF